MNYKNILIIGGANGIGKAIMEELVAKQQVKIFIFDCDQESLIKIKKQYGKINIFIVDIKDRQQVKKSINGLKNYVHHLDVVIMSAGVHCTYPIEFLTDNLIDKVFDINLISQIKIIRDVLPLLKEKSRIIGISSSAACLGTPMASLYSASKAAIESFFEALSIEVCYKKIKCIIIHISTVNTGFNSKGNDYKCDNRPIDKCYAFFVNKINNYNGMSPQYAAKKIIATIYSKRPKLFYVFGKNAKKANLAKRLIGREMSLKLLAKHYKFTP